MQNQPTQQPRIGIDLGGTKIELIIMQGDGAISHRQRCDTPQSDYQATLTALNSLITDSASKAGLPDKLPIGIGTPGENSTVFGVILGTGVGGGIVLNKRLNQGVNAISGEWGHNTLPIHALKYPLPASLLESPRLCFCGRQHCVETWIAGPAFENNFRLQFGESATAPEIMQRVRSGDPLSIMVFEQYQHLLALGLANVINILDPAAIVLGGGLSNIDELYENIPGLLPHYVFSDVIHTKILKAKYGDSSGVRGAAWLWTTREVKQILESS
jgi:fructokinase